MGTQRIVPGQSDGLTADNYAFLERYIHRESGIILGPDKLYLVKSRLQPLLEHERIASLNALCDRLRATPPETLRRKIVESMTTHETLFFRDPTAFDALRNDIIPELTKARAATKKLRIWSAACSSGQEPYSLAMMLLEAGYGDWDIEILATDLSTQILDRAAAASYLQIEVNRGLPAPLLIRYFQRAGLDWRLKDNVRKMVRFQKFDLRDSMSVMGPFDLVLCRNVLIYFEIDARKQILAGIRNRLTQGGYLMLGASETTFNIDETFVRRSIKTIVVYQAPVAGGK